MCGITGVFDTRGKSAINPKILRAMNQSQMHRGPDEEGLHLEPGLGLGHRRLSIIDLASGQQPLFNEDGTVAVVFNGEIYNFQDLIPELQALGHKFSTRCDTEVIVHAWEAWGESCVDRFRGMFAFALWDRKRETLFMARDRLGVKPLYYSILSDGTLLFGSELKTIVAHPGFQPRISPFAVEEYFALGYVPEPRTIYQDAFKLPPGTTLTVVRGKPVAPPKTYWDVPFKPIVISEQDAAEELIVRLRESVKLRMISEVPIGAFLSGGVDSGAVVAMMSQLSGSSVNTCSIGFDDPKFDETRYAARVAEQYKTNHHVQHVNPNDFSLVDQLAALYDEPFADSSALPTYRVCEVARRHVTVALSGDGGDENLAGYRRYRFHMAEERFRGLLPHGLRHPIFGALGRLYPKADWAPRMFRAKTTFESLARDSVSAYFHSVSMLSDGLRAQLFSREFKQSLQGYGAVEVLRRHAKNAPTSHPLSLIQYLDMKTYLPGDILTKVDRASMAHSLEVREPLLDHPMVEWISGLSPEYKLRGGEGKHIFKKALGNYLPEDILYRPKMGFAVPLAAWFRGPLKDRIEKAVLSETLADSGIFNRQFLVRMLEDHRSGRRDYSTPLWSVLMFESFLKLPHAHSSRS